MAGCISSRAASTCSCCGSCQRVAGTSSRERRMQLWSLPATMPRAGGGQRAAQPRGRPHLRVRGALPPLRAPPAERRHAHASLAQLAEVAPHGGGVGAAVGAGQGVEGRVQGLGRLEAGAYGRVLQRTQRGGGRRKGEEVCRQRWDRRGEQRTNASGAAGVQHRGDVPAAAEPSHLTQLVISRPPSPTVTPAPTPAASSGAALRGPSASTVRRPLGCRTCGREAGDE